MIIAKCKKRPSGRSRTGVCDGAVRNSALEHTGVDETLLGDAPAVVRVRGVERGELRADLRAVAGRGQDADLLDEGVRVGPQVVGPAVRQVPHVREAAVGERDEVFVLTE